MTLLKPLVTVVLLEIDLFILDQVTSQNTIKIEIEENTRKGNWSWER